MSILLHKIDDDESLVVENMILQGERKGGGYISVEESSSSLCLVQEQTLQMNLARHRSWSNETNFPR